MSRLFAGTAFDIPPSCDDCGKLESECICTPQQKAAAERARQTAADRLPPEKQTAKIRVETRKGKRTVTVIDGLTAKANDLPALLSKLQAACGTGGTVRVGDGKTGDRIELQGNHVNDASKRLSDLGYRVRS